MTTICWPRVCARRTVCATTTAIASASLLETWIDEAERRVWFLYEAKRREGTPAR